MPALEDSKVVEIFVRKLRGGSQSILARANDGLLYVVKFRNNLQGPNLLFNEAMGYELYRRLGLPVPKWTPLTVTKAFINKTPACWFETAEGFLKPSAGRCFGSRFLGADGCGVLEILPGAYFSRVVNREAFSLAWLVDASADHTDCRQAIFCEGPKGNLQAVFIDHGSMFGGANGDTHPTLDACHYLDARIYDTKCFVELKRTSDVLDEAFVQATLRVIPEEWQTASALQRFRSCLSKLMESSLAADIRERLLDLNARTFNKHASFDAQRFNFRAPAVLRAGIHRKGRLRRTTV